MFIGHLAAAFLTKRVCPTVSLGTAILATQWADLLWTLLVFADVERVTIEHNITAVYPLKLEYMPWSHGLAMSLVWAACGCALFLVLGRGIRTGLIMAAAVLSHWLLDAIAHPADMPLGFASDTKRVGLGLWDSFSGTLCVELGFFAISVWLYMTATSPSNSKGTWQLHGLVAFLVVLYGVTLFGPQPPNGESTFVVLLPGLLMWAIAWWGHVADSNRTATALHSQTNLP